MIRSLIEEIVHDLALATLVIITISYIGHIVCRCIDYWWECADNYRDNEPEKEESDDNK